MVQSATLQESHKIKDRIIRWRRHLHAHPELSGNERETSAFVAEELRAMGYDPICHIGGYGVTAMLAVGDTPCIALRADMDALPIQEENDVAFRSTVAGAMHACGHDAHTAMLLGAAAILKKRAGALRQSVKLIFQPAEEQYPGGAAPMIADGVLDGVERIFGIHVWSELECGKMTTRSGPMMSSVDGIVARIVGRGGHAAMPSCCTDPIVAASHAVVALQTVVSRSIDLTDSAVVSVTQFHAGTADNVIPPEVALRGTIRTLDAGVRDTVCEKVRHVLESTARVHGAEAIVEIERGYPVLVNDAANVERAKRAATKAGISRDNIIERKPIGGGEDFAYYLQKTPGCFVFLGALDPVSDRAYPHHHPRFSINEDVLPLGAALHVQFCLESE
jgi:amidohydrolase